MLPPLGVVLLLLATLLCPPAMAQFPQQQGWPYSNQYQYQQQQQPNTFYRQFGAQTPYGSYAPTFGPRSFGGGASSPYSAANSYYGYGTNSPAFYQQNRVPADCSPFGQNPFGGGAGGYPRYPFYPQQQQQFAGGQGHQQYFASPPMVAGQQPSAFYSHQSPAAFSPPFDSMPFGGTGHFDDGFPQLVGEKQKRILRQKRQTNDGKDDRRARRQAAADEDEFSGFSINLPLMSVAVPEMPNPIASSKCNVQKNPEEGDYFMALQFVC